MARKVNSLRTAMYRYLQACQVKRRSLKTLSWYRQKLEAFRGYLAQRWQIQHVSAITEEHVAAFLTLLEGEVSQATVKGYRQVLNGFFRWCLAQGLRESNPVGLSMKTVAGATAKREARN